MQPPTDNELMERVRAGDESAFELLYHRHEARVYAFVWRLVREEALAADLCQEAFVRIWRSRTRWKPGGSVAGYLIRTCRTLVIDEHRRKEVRDRWAHEVAASPVQMAPAPDRAVETRELAAGLAAAIDSLPDRTREVFTLKRDGDLTYREIAEMLGISPKTVDAHMNKALGILRSELANLR